MKYTRVVLFVALVALMLQGCVVSREDYLALQDQVAIQERNQRQLSQQVAQLSQEMSSTEGELKKTIETSNTPMRSTQANLWAEIEQIKIRLATLQGEIDAATIKTKQFSDFEDNATIALQEISGSLTAMRMALESQLALEIGPAPAVQGHSVALAESDDKVGQVAERLSTAKQANDKTPGDPAKALYDQAMNFFRQREYGKAQALWADVVREYPKHALASNAIFWQGECFYQTQDYARAVLSYQEVIEKYKKSTKYAPALLKQGISFTRLGKKKAGKLILQDLVQKFPNSPEGKRAATLLKDM